MAPDLRLRIEHFQIVNESDVHRITQRGESGGDGHACILASMQPTHATSDMAYAEARLGQSRDSNHASVVSVRRACGGCGWPASPA